MLDIRQGEKGDNEQQEKRTGLKSTSGLIVSAGGLIFGVVASRLLGIRNEGLLCRVGEVLTSEVMVLLSAKWKCISPSKQYVTYPESAMTNVIDGTIEDGGCQGGAVGSVVYLLIE